MRTWSHVFKPKHCVLHFFVGVVGGVVVSNASHLHPLQSHLAAFSAQHRCFNHCNCISVASLQFARHDQLLLRDKYSWTHQNSTKTHRVPRRFYTEGYPARARPREYGHRFSHQSMWFRSLLQQVSYIRKLST